MGPDLTSDVSAAEEIASSLERVGLATWDPVYAPGTARLPVLSEATVLTNTLREAFVGLHEVIGSQAANLRQIATEFLEADALLASSLDQGTVFRRT